MSVSGRLELALHCMLHAVATLHSHVRDEHFLRHVQPLITCIALAFAHAASAPFNAAYVVLPPAPPAAETKSAGIVGGVGDVQITLPSGASKRFRREYTQLSQGCKP